ncbi:MAG: hypothetical protein KKC75_04600 [Nanoarchaeota archaeon]|nr:hypothetical protein [Nanoarchaeota archaeon]MBU1005403.1 hypothetical protein [Nanoarchaeota archaeon]
MKNFFEGKKLPYIKIVKKCPKCGLEFVTYISGLDSNGTGIESPLAMKCDKCGQTEFCDTEVDPLFKCIRDYYLEKNTLKPNTLWTIYPWSSDIYKQYEKTFEDCECGGKFRVLRNVCPVCGFESDYKKKPEEVESQRVEFTINLAQHKPFKSLLDICDPELKKIFKDFDFGRLNTKK